MTNSFLRAALRGAVLLLLTAQCAVGATLAQITGDAGLRLEWDVMLLSFVFCTVSGLAALLHRVNAELRANPEAELPHPLVFCASHLVGSWAAGLLAFIIAQQMRFDVWASLGAMMAASFQGARWLEAYAESRLPRPPPEGQT